ncbi:uncharacterized protein ARMOST_16141 [Armillaria ostoyae]|uniref:Tetrapyrrole biosynthesis uroporphyrinogen III synthase domain-containing protein n=1 Tax=Armillaria ostoyae TaxID=47428 RepID=A0A284RVC8_ARMOS|nr:uncharacterized protein ARMOST_16141 [Armillaria ostoyae]
MTLPFLQQITRLSRFQGETVLTNITELAPVTALGDFDGIITTAACFYDALDSKTDGTVKDGASGIHLHKMLFSSSPTESPFYIVGKVTASMLRSVMPNVGICGQYSGTTEQLADFTLAILPHPTRLLYLIGDKNRDTLSGPLGGEEDFLHLLKVYRAQCSPVFAQCLKEIVPEILNAPWWIVFFAPNSFYHI